MGSSVPPWWRAILKNGTDYTFWSRDHKCCPIFMFDDILDSGQQLSVFGGISVHFKTIFHINFKILPLSGGDTKTTKITPICPKFLFKFDWWFFFIICNLQLIKNNQKTCPNMHFKKKFPKKHSVHIPGYLP